MILSRVQKLAELYEPVGHDAQQAYQAYPDQKYQNKKGQVFPIGVIYIDYLNTILTMVPEEAAQFVVDKINELNNQFSFEAKDKKTCSYSAYSQDKINEMKMNLSKQKTIEGVAEYLTNAYFKGIGMGMTSWKSAELDSTKRLTK